MSPLIDLLLPAIEKIAENLAGGPLAAQAGADADALKAIAARHAEEAAAEAERRAGTLEAEVTEWWSSLAHPSVPEAPEPPALSEPVAP